MPSVKTVGVSARSLLAAALLSAAIGAVAVPNAGAATAPTLSGPSSVKYNQTVDLTGTTPSPSEQVTVYAKDPTMSSYLVLARPTSDANGQFTLTYAAQMSESLYAVAGGVSSAVIVVPLVTSSCSVSSTALSSPLPSNGPDSTDILAFTANRGPVWAGMAESDGLFDTVIWRPGVPLRVLGSDRLMGWHPGGLGTAWVAGITPHGYVASTVWPKAYVWINYVRHQVAHAPNWTVEELTGVSAGGTLIGEVETGTTQATYRWAVVAWSEDGSRYMVIKLNATAQPAIIDGAGDVAYENTDATTSVRVASTGQIVSLRGDQADPGTVGVTAQAGGSGAVLYGSLNNGDITRWTIPQANTPSTVAAVQLSPAPGGVAGATIAASPRGDVSTVQYLANNTRSYHVLTAQDTYNAAPQQFFNTGSAFDSNGTYAYTGIGGRVRFFSCT